MHYYNTHIRNLEEEAFLQKRKISAQLHQQSLLKEKQSLAQTFRSKGFSKLKQSRREQDRQTAAYLERSRLQAELSAARAKAEGSMNRSRIQAAFELRRQNQKALQQTQRLHHKHYIMQRKAQRELLIAHHHFQSSKDQVDQRLRQEDRLLRLYQNEKENELQRAYRYSLLQKQSYLPY